ncbi:IS21 family transposase, partial [Rhodococcus sp. PAE-6]|nr:IS21 family transposase [Rhodococcus sp. PAE-6]
PVDALVEDRARMLDLPPVAPTTGLRTTERLARDYYVRIDSLDYSVDPRVIGRLVEVVASLHKVTVNCAGALVAEHR